MGPKRPASNSPRVSAVAGGPRPTPPIRFGDDPTMAASTNSPVPSSRALAKARAKALRDRKQGCCSPRRSSAGRGGGGFLATLINFTFKIGIFYVIIGALWHCSSKPFSFEYSANDPRALCRNLYTVKAELTPHLHDLHAQLSPHVEPYIAPLRPYAQQAYKRGKPIYNDLTKRGALAWKRYGEPKRQQAEKAARKWADPHIKRARKEWKKQVQPHIDHAHKTTKPYQDTYMRDVHPHVLNAYAFSSDVSTRASGFYLAHVQPNLIKATKQSYAFYKAHILPYLRRAFSLYVRPAVDKALAKVFQRQVGEARKEAVKEAKKDADLAREAAAQEAASKSASKIASVIRAQESPTYMEQAKQAVFGKDDPEEALRIARLDAELDTEQAAIRSDLAAWENQHVKLVQQQYRLTLQRVADLRNRALVDLPDRFALLSADVVQGEVQSVLSRLEREFEKLSSEEDERSTAEKVAVFDALVEREIEALRDAKKAKDTDLDNFFVALATEEIDTADAAIKELDLFTVDAKRAYDELMEKAKFEATVEEFVSWDDELVLRSLMLRQELLEVFKGERKPNLAFGAVDLSAEPKIDAEVGKLKKQTDTVFDAAVSEIRSYGNSALLQLRGEGVRRQIQAVSGSIAESASAISSDISAGLSDAIHAAKVKLSLEDDPSLLSSLSKSASSAASAASSAAAALTSDVSDRASAADKKARAAASSAAQAARSGVRSAASAAGASVTPETPREYAESVAADLSSAAGQATDAVKDAGASASSLLHKATRSVASAVGASVTPETREEYVEAAQASASSVAQAARSSVAAGAEAVQSSVAAGAEAVQSSVAAGAEAVQSSVAAGVEAVQSGVAAGAEAVQSGAASAYADASAGASAAFAQASSLLHQATRSAASAAGASVTPESIGDYLKVIQDQAESINDAIRSAGADAVDAAGSGIHHATRSIASAVGATPSPESASEYAEYASKKAGDAYASAASFVGGAASQLSERAAAAGSDAASLLHQATRSASSAVGATPTPERAGEYVESIVGQAQSAYEGAAGYVSDAYEGAASYVSDAADAAYSVVATDASSVLHQATRSAASAAGYKPSPEGIREHFESATSKAAEAAQSVASRLHDEL